MKLPKILYHGTTLLRWNLGIRANGLKGDMPTHMKFDEGHKGYSYFSSNIHDAAFYSLYTLEMDNLVPEMKKLNTIANSGVVLTIKTSNIRDGFEEDPEYYEYKEKYSRYGYWDIAQKTFMIGNWFRFKGNISSKNFVGTKDVPMSIQQPIVQELAKKQAMSAYNDNFTQLLMEKAQKDPNWVQLKNKSFLNFTEGMSYFLKNHKGHKLCDVNERLMNNESMLPNAFVACFDCKEAVIFDTLDRKFIVAEVDDETTFVRKEIFK